MKTKTIYIFLTQMFACLLAVAGCDKRGIEFYSEGEPEQKPITISDVNMDWDTKAAILDTITFGDFGLYAGLSRSNYFDDNAVGTDYMKNARVTKDWSAGNWNTNVTYYWPLGGNGTLSFFPYAPYITDTTVLKLSPSYTTGEPVLLYTPNSSAQYQKDFCVSPALYDKTASDNPLSVHFGHTLTYIQFWTNYKAGASGLPANVYIKVDKVTLHNIIGTKGITWKRVSPYYEWSEDREDRNVDYSISRISEELTDTEVPSQPDTIHLDLNRGRLYLLPQTINEPSQVIKSSLEIDFSFFRNDDGTEVLISSFNIVKDLPSGTVWAPSSVVRYIFTLNVENLSEVEISTSTLTWIEDWEDSGNTVPNQTIEK